MSVLTLQEGTVYQTCMATWRGVEFLMNYYPTGLRAVATASTHAMRGRSSAAPNRTQ